MNILSYYNLNRKKIWITCIAIIFIIIAIHGIDNYVGDKTKNSNSISENSISIVTQNVDINNNQKQNINANAVSQKENTNTVSNLEKETKTESIIDIFIKNCNNGQIENAYNLLSEDCKKYVYPTIESFKNNYINSIFNSQKMYSINTYNVGTYKIRFYEDVLSSGKISEEAIEDYYTIIDENGKQKLNINGFIIKTELNQKTETDKFVINIVSRKIFKDYEEYEIDIKNMTNKNIMLDGMEKTNTVYLVGAKNVMYYSQLYELIDGQLLVPASVSRKINIKFTKEYNSNNEINKMVFSNIILEYDKYDTMQNKEEYKDRAGIIVNF